MRARPFLFVFGLISGLMTATRILAQVCVPVPDGIVSWWPGDGDASDLVGGNSGILIGGVTFPNGEVGPAFSFGGIGGAVLIGNPANLQLNQSLTIEAWTMRASVVRTTASGGAGSIFAYGQNGYVFGIYDDGRLALSKHGIDEVTTGSVRVTDTNLHHLAVTKSGSTTIFYIDGAPTPPQTYNPQGGFTFTTNAAIGANGDNFNGALLGLIDELSIYNRALTAEEIQSIVAAGAAGKCRPPSK